LKQNVFQKKKTNKKNGINLLNICKLEKRQGRIIPEDRISRYLVEAHYVNITYSSTPKINSLLFDELSDYCNYPTDADMYHRR